MLLRFIAVNMMLVFLTSCTISPFSGTSESRTGKRQPLNEIEASSIDLKLKKNLVSTPSVLGDDSETAEDHDEIALDSEYDNEESEQAFDEGAVGNSFWPLLTSKFGLDLDEENPRIKAQRDWYAKHPAYINRVLKRSKPYIQHIFNEASSRGVPAELVLLPIVESAFDPFAYSHGRAAGLWQFIPGTAEMYGLKQTWWYDGRRDILASTNAAFNYLESLSKQFSDDWLLALAAYNSGAGTVNRAIRHNKKLGKNTDYWSLSLPKETSNYIPKLLAIAQIIRQPEAFGLSILPISVEPYFVKVETQSQIDLAQAAKLAEIDLNELYRLNPGFNRWATDPDGPHHLLIPAAKSELFESNLKSLPKEKRVEWARYAIKPGDSLIRIAKSFKTTPKLIRDINHLKGNTIVAGKTLLIPKASGQHSDYTLGLEQRIDALKNKSKSGRSKQVHIVKSGDNFWDLARKYKTNHFSLAKWNGMAPNDPLKIGQKLTIWSGKKGPSEKIKKIFYKTRKGDSYAGIAQKFNVTLAQLQQWNQINLKKYLQPGKKLTLYVDITNAP